MLLVVAINTALATTVDVTAGVVVVVRSVATVVVVDASVTITVDVASVVVSAADVADVGAVVTMRMSTSNAVVAGVAIVVLLVFSANPFIIKFRRTRNYTIVHAH